MPNRLLYSAQIKGEADEPAALMLHVGRLLLFARYICILVKIMSVTHLIFSLSRRSQLSLISSQVDCDQLVSPEHGHYLCVMRLEVLV